MGPATMVHIAPGDKEHHDSILACPVAVHARSSMKYRSAARGSSPPKIAGTPTYASQASAQAHARASSTYIRRNKLTPCLGRCAVTALSCTRMALRDKWSYLI